MLPTALPGPRRGTALHASAAVTGCPRVLVRVWGRSWWPPHLRRVPRRWRRGRAPAKQAGGRPSKSPGRPAPEPTTGQRAFPPWQCGRGPVRHRPATRHRLRAAMQRQSTNHAGDRGRLVLLPVASDSFFLGCSLQWPTAACRATRVLRLSTDGRVHPGDSSALL